eukprot:scaffold9442_cov117-Isochrysis_galbana.AAC.12
MVRMASRRIPHREATWAAKAALVTAHLSHCPGFIRTSGGDLTRLEGGPAAQARHAGTLRAADGREDEQGPEVRAPGGGQGDGGHDWRHAARQGAAAGP